MKVITIKQPWATLIAEGIKKYEFRSWKTNYRGKLLIHAGSSVDREYMKLYKNLGFEFPTKRIIAEVTLEDCLEFDDELNDKLIKENNIAYGNYRRTGFAWKLKDIKKLDIDKEVNGQLGLWNYDIE